MIELNNENIANWTRLGMRKAFGSMLESVAEDHSNLIALTADVADSANLVQFSKRFPNKFFNIGIAEMNMTGIACGLAKEGHNVFISSFAPFVTMRNYEAVRTLIGYMNLNVKIVGLASGMSLGVQGNTHYSLEDISLMRTIPNMLILSPTDVIEEAKCIEFLADYEGPAYLRLTGIDGTPSVYKEDSTINLCLPNLIREGEDIVIFSTGSITSECNRASRALKKDGFNCSLYEICNLKPIDKNKLLDIIGKYKLIVTVEEHFINGGLGSIISEFISETNADCRLLRIGLEDKFLNSGNYSYMLNEANLSASHIRNKIIDKLKS